MVVEFSSVTLTNSTSDILVRDVFHDFLNLRKYITLMLLYCYAVTHTNVLIVRVHLQPGRVRVRPRPALLEPL